MQHRGPDVADGPAQASRVDAGIRAGDEKVAVRSLRDRRGAGDLQEAARSCGWRSGRGWSREGHTRYQQSDSAEAEVVHGRHHRYHLLPAGTPSRIAIDLGI